MRACLPEPSPAGDGAPPFSLAATRRDVSAETPPAPAPIGPSGRLPVLPYLADGPHVSAETSRRIACDCSRVVMRHAPDGPVLDVGRRTRTVPPALRRAVAHRDRGCRFPGCGLALCDHHHLHHWADGGETNLTNLTQLCRVHHRAVHEGGFTVERLPDGELRFRRPDGRVLVDAPPLPPVPAATPAALTTRWHRQGIAGDGAASLPSWDGEPLDLDWTVDALRRTSVAR